jgi:threonine dehydratase
MSEQSPPDISEILAARARLGDAIVRTPTRHSLTLSQIYGAELWFKFDNLQFTSSFKERGALNKMLQLSDAQLRRGVIAASAGNHAQAVAHHARRLGTSATIVMPTTTPFLKVTNTQVLGATIVQHGTTVDEAQAEARRIAREQQLVPIPPFDDPFIVAGQGTLAVELIEDAPPLDVLVVPVGGGGLISGVAIATRALSPQTRIIGVQVERFSTMTQLLHDKKRGFEPNPDASEHPTLSPFGADTLADGIAVKSPGTLTRHIVEDLVDDMLLVTEAALERAVNDYIQFEKTIVEGAGAAALAAVSEHNHEFAGKRVACVVSGGNIDSRALADTIMRGLARTGRLARLRMDVRDLPGSLATLTRIVADAGANVVDVSHERVFLATSAQRTRLSIEIATRDHAHVERVVQALRDAGHDVEAS